MKAKGDENGEVLGDHWLVGRETWWRELLFLQMAEAGKG